MSRFGKVAVLMGGPSAEREISLISGKAVLEALHSKGVDAHAFDPKERELFDLKREGFARAFIALHGRFGEDGTVQGALEVMRIPYTGSGVMASALAMDKWRTKLVWDASGIPTPRFAMVGPGTNWEKVVEALGLPLIIKPAREGSSIGVTKVMTAADVMPAYQLAAKLDELVIAEEFVKGHELTASVLGDTALPLIRIEAPEGKYDYQNKYFTDVTKYYCPSGVEPDLEEEIRALTLKCFRVLGCRGWGRADLILAPEGRYSFIEMNTSPGMTGHSLVPIAARQAGMSYADLCVRILEMATLDSGNAA
ncbi:MAG TPA: D-alanine--D-alanine ligase [Usitatibacter sp.]|nr:D-alanine--D-alanine ligase [Usitatibacter sp.]